MAAVVLVLPSTVLVIGAFGFGLVSIVQLKWYGFVLVIVALVMVRPVIALAVAAWTGQSPAWFEEQYLDQDEAQEWQRRHE